MASPTWWTWAWARSSNWWWTGKPVVLQSMGSKRVGHDWMTELNWIIYNIHFSQVSSGKKIIFPFMHKIWNLKRCNFLNQSRWPGPSEGGSMVLLQGPLNMSQAYKGVKVTLVPSIWEVNRSLARNNAQQVGSGVFPDPFSGESLTCQNKAKPTASRVVDESWGFYRNESSVIHTCQSWWEN